MILMNSFLLRIIPTGLLCFLSFGHSSAAPIDLSNGTAAQSSTLSNFVASNALDGVENFTHTVSTDNDPTWQVLLPASKTFQQITLHNRGGTGSWLSRFRDITVQIIDFNGNVNSDFNGGTVIYTSPLLNPNNILGSPETISVDVGGVTGNMIRVTRTQGPSTGDDRVLSLDEVVAEGPDTITCLLYTSPSPRDA